MNWDKLDPKLRERIIRQDPANFNVAGIITRAPGPVGAVPRPKPEPHPLPALDPKPKARASRKRRLAVIVTLISARHQLLDDDNLRGAFKGLRDAISRSIGLDDADKRLVWQYAQVQTTGAEGSLVTIETKNK